MAVHPCQNCYRTGISISSIQWNELSRKKRKKYFSIRGCIVIEINLCDLCLQYLLGRSKSPQCAHYWPSMIWKFLTHKALHVSCIEIDVKNRWKLIPEQWRPWWIYKLKQIDNDLTITYPEASFHLGTRDFNILMQAIHDLEWKSLAKAMDAYLSYPSVRCPFGCSEFLHLCNKLPLEDFLIFHSNGNFDGYAPSSRNKVNWTNGVKTQLSLFCDYP